MKFISIALLSILFAQQIPALASELIVPSANETYFDMLEEMYTQSVRPDVEKITGIVHSGRCFKRGEPDLALNATYKIKEYRDVDAGPIGKIKYEAISFWWTSTYSKPSENLKYYPLQITEKELVLTRELTRTRLRDFQGTYLIEAHTKKSHEMGHGKMEISMYCYYF